MRRLRICILSREPKSYSTRRLKEAAEKRGHEAKVLNTTSFSILVESGKPALRFRNKPLSTYDAVIPRIGASVTFYGTAIVRQFEQMGVYSVNPAHAISVSRDKLRSIQILSRHRIGIPKTAFVRRKDAALPAIEEVGGAPVIIKLLEGTQGIGVILADNNKIAEAIIETLQSTKQHVLIQNFVEESKGKDVRAFVVGGHVIGAMRRTATGGEFRSNVHRGGNAEAITLTPEYEKAAVQAAQIMGLRVAGVDMLEAAGGPQIMEVNSSPGLQGIERATGIDIAESIISHIETEVIFPEVDIRQRLTLQRGYGVAELTIDPGSEFVGKSVAGSGLRERDVVVLTIQRGAVSIPNPRSDREILAGDHLFCFGKMETMRALMPNKPSTPKKAKKKKKKKVEEGATPSEPAIDAATATPDVTPETPG